MRAQSKSPRASILPARIGQRCVSIPKEQEFYHSVNNSFLTGCLSFLFGPDDCCNGPMPVHWKTAKEAIELGKLTFFEWTAANNVNAKNWEGFEESRTKFQNHISALGQVFYAGDFKNDYMPLESTVNDVTMMDTIGRFVENNDGTLKKIILSWPSSVLTGMNLFEIGNRIWYESFNPWNCNLSPIFMMLRLELEILDAYSMYARLDPLQQRNPRNQSVIKCFYTTTIFHAAARRFAKSSQMSLSGPVFETRYLQNISLCESRSHLVNSLESYKARLQNEEFVSLLDRTHTTLHNLETAEMQVQTPTDKQSISKSIESLKSVRPLKYIYEPLDEASWRSVLDQAEVIAMLFAPESVPVLQPLMINGVNQEIVAENGPEQPGNYDTESEEEQSSEDSPTSSASSKKSRTAKRRELTKAKKQRDAVDSHSAQNERMAKALRDAEEHMARLITERKELEERMITERKDLEEAIEKQRKAEERAAKKQKEEELAKKRKQEQDELEAKAMKEAMEREIKARKEAADREAKKLKEKAEQEAKKLKEKAEQEAKKLKENAEQEAKERMEAAVLEAISLVNHATQAAQAQREQIEREAKARKDANDIAQVNRAFDIILPILNEDSKKLPPQLLLKFMQIYAPSLVRFARFEDDEGMDALSGACQICFMAFNTSTKKPSYLKCCGQAICGQCMCKVTKAPHPNHAIELDPGLINQWIVMRRALGLPVPEY